MKTKDKKEETPNPGSKEAQELGCKCAIIENHFGAGVNYNGVQEFWVNGDCELHGKD